VILFLDILDLVRTREREREREIVSEGWWWNRVGGKVFKGKYKETSGSWKQNIESL